MARLYDRRRWRDHIAPDVLADEPWCRYCRSLNVLTPAEVVDHIVKVKDAPDLAFERSNLQPLCKAHHDSAKKQAEARGYHSEIDANGYPTDRAHPANMTPRDATGGRSQARVGAMTTAPHPSSDRNG